MPHSQMGNPIQQWTVLRVAVVIAAVIAAIYTVQWIDAPNLQIQSVCVSACHWTILISAIAYTILLAIPFVPGVEIAISMIVFAGPNIVWLVYLSTLAGLCLSFTIGRLVPLRRLIELLETMGLTQAGLLLREIAPMARAQRLEHLLCHAPNRWLPFLVKHRYIALALAINLPGNSLIGGGGGIAMIAGLSGLFSFPGYVAAVAIATLPVPLAVHIFGLSILPA